jgi:hypothetical protein
MQELSHAFWMADGDFTEFYAAYRTGGTPRVMGISRRATAGIEAKRERCADHSKNEPNCDVDFLTCMVGRPVDIKVTTNDLGSSTSKRETSLEFIGGGGATTAVRVKSIQEDGRWKVDEVECPPPKG